MKLVILSLIILIKCPAGLCTSIFIYKPAPRVWSSSYLSLIRQQTLRPCSPQGSAPANGRWMDRSLQRAERKWGGREGKIGKTNSLKISTKLQDSSENRYFSVVLRKWHFLSHADLQQLLFLFLSPFPRPSSPPPPPAAAGRTPCMVWGETF